MTTETMMTEPAATTTEGAPASVPDAPTATEAAQGAQTQRLPEGQVAEGVKPAEGTGTKGDEPKPGTKPEAKPEGAPEKYEFQPTEGVAEVDPQVIGQFAEVAKELNLSQDQAQKIIDKVAPAMQARQAEQLQAARTQWAEDAKADKEFGGEKLAENLAVAKKAMDTFGTPELRSLLNDSGLGNHPELIRFMYRAGKAISEDTFVNSGGAAPAEPKTTAQRMYPNMNP